MVAPRDLPWEMCEFANLADVPPPLPATLQPSFFNRNHYHHCCPSQVKAANAQLGQELKAAMEGALLALQ